LGQVGLLVCSGIISFVVALSTAVLIPVVAERFDGGVVEPLRPSAYCVARGLGPFDSDALVLAMEWRNARAEAVQVRQPYLILGSLGDHRASDRVDPLNEHRFVLVGTYPNLNAAEFSYPYDRQTSFALETESISSRVLIFRPENYWDEEDPRGESDFRFRSARDWSVRVGYQYSERGELVEPESVVYLFDIDVYPSVGGIRSGAGLQADCWDFARGDG
jgi:hypothetical protein